MVRLILRLLIVQRRKELLCKLEVAHVGCCFASTVCLQANEGLSERECLGWVDCAIFLSTN